MTDDLHQCFPFMKSTEDTVLGRHGAHAAKPVQPDTRSEQDTVTTRDPQMAGKTVLN